MHELIDSIESAREKMPQNFQPEHNSENSLLAALYSKSLAASYDISSSQFSTILIDIQKKYLSATAGASEVQELFQSLRVEDLALARACAAGSEKAWDVFMTRFREKLYDIATYITKESSTGRELADSIYADLYGTVLKDGKRVSKLGSYTGRGSLEGWLRTVIAQEFVNRYRKGKRLVSLEEETEGGTQFAAPEAALEIPTPLDPRLESSTDEALAGLPGEDRFILAAYFLEDRTLAEIARILSVHESTISRKVDKLLKSVRKGILTRLVRRGMSRRQAEEALEADIRDLRINIRKSLMQETGVTSFSEGKAEMPDGKVKP